MQNKKALLVILDGWGKGKIASVDAIQQGATPCYDSLLEKYPNANLVTYGEEVGLPEGQMGNSEVGHLNIGAGRIVYQELARINKAIKDDTLMSEATIAEAIAYAKEKKKTVHFLGLLSDGGVHSHINHLKALVSGFAAEGIDSIKIHGFMDGRDTDPQGGADYIRELQEAIADTPATIATLIGRYYAMDRDLRWERIKKAYDLLVKGIGTKAKDAVAALEDSYAQNITDEFIEPTIIDEDAQIKEGDVVFFINFRTDRPRQITRALTQESFEEYDMQPLSLYFVTMTEYDKTYEGLHVVFTKDLLKNTLGEVVQDAGLTQVRIAETEKYPHVTFFFSGGREAGYDGEYRILVSSPKVATYDLAPEMSAVEVTDKICAYINSDHPDFICLNYANADMVGHTGDFDAAKVAVETVDTCLSRLIDTALADDYEIIVIADHGNSDFMINEDGSPNTAHTTNLVPLIYVSADPEAPTAIKDGKLADVAPTILGLMGVDLPIEMTGDNLLA